MSMYVPMSNNLLIIESKCVVLKERENYENALALLLYFEVPHIELV